MHRACGRDLHLPFYVCFFFNATAPTEIYTLSLHDALPISSQRRSRRRSRPTTSRSSCSAWRGAARPDTIRERSEEHTSNSSHSQISYAVFCLKKKKTREPVAKSTGHRGWIYTVQFTPDARR